MRNKDNTNYFSRGENKTDTIFLERVLFNATTSKVKDMLHYSLIHSFSNRFQFPKIFDAEWVALRSCKSVSLRLGAFVSIFRIFIQHDSSYEQIAYITALKTMNCKKNNKRPIQLTQTSALDSERKVVRGDQLSDETHRLDALPYHMSKPDDG